MEDRNKKEEFSLFDNNIPVSIKQYKTTGEELCFDLHWHEKAEILAVNQGALHSVTGGNLLTVKKGQILFVNPCELHSAKSDSGGVQYDCIIIEPNFFVSLNMDACDKALVDFQNMSIKISNIISDKRMFAIIRKAINEYNKKSPNFELFVRAHLLLFMSEALRGHVNTQKFKGNEEIAKIIKYIGNNYSDALSSKQLSEKFGFSLSYFCRIFKNTVGETPINYVNAVRINKACELLQKTSLPVTEVAGAVGYTGINYFNRQFKKIMKCTPLQLRNRHP